MPVVLGNWLLAILSTCAPASLFLHKDFLAETLTRLTSRPLVSTRFCLGIPKLPLLLELDLGSIACPRRLTHFGSVLRLCANQVLF
jgi:hypothetical protein